MKKREGQDIPESVRRQVISEMMRERGLKRAADQTPEERTEQARHAVTARWKKAGAKGRAEIGRKLAEARKKAAEARAAEKGGTAVVRKRKRAAQSNPE